MLQLGASKHWTYALNLLTGQNKITADSLLKYFAPLNEWLIKENSKYPNETVGF
jgi:hypothetical protein